jgi:hypothetical protein
MQDVPAEIRRRARHKSTSLLDFNARTFRRLHPDEA